MPARSFEVGKPQLGLDLDVLYVVIVGPWMSHSMSDFAAWAERCSELRFTYTGCLTAASQLPFLSGLGGEESAGTPIPKCNPDIADQPCDFGRGRGSRYRNSKALWRWRRLQAAKSPEIRGYVWVCTVCVLLSENGGCTPKWNQRALWMRKWWLTISHRIQGYPRVTGSWMPHTLAHTDQPKTSWHLVPQINGKEAAQKFLSRGGF